MSPKSLPSQKNSTQGKLVPICHHCRVKSHIKPHYFKLHGYAHKNVFEKDVKKLVMGSRIFKKDLHEAKKQSPFRQVFKSGKESQRSKILQKSQESFQKFKTRTIWVRKNKLHPHVDMTIHHLDEFRTFRGVYLAF